MAAPVEAGRRDSARQGIGAGFELLPPAGDTAGEADPLRTGCGLAWPGGVDA
jgi:hypothetical protein